MLRSRRQRVDALAHVNGERNSAGREELAPHLNQLDAVAAARSKVLEVH